MLIRVQIKIKISLEEFLVRITSLFSISIILFVLSLLFKREKCSNFFFKRK